MNFNYNGTQVQDIHRILIDEVISLYGIVVKFLVTQKINEDPLVYGDYSHVKSNNSSVYDIYMLPEDSGDWDHTGDAFSQFGLSNYENVQLLVSKRYIVDNIPEMATNSGGLIGNLVVLPNNKIMEITSASWEQPGISNVYTSNDEKSVIRLSCKPYDSKLIQEINPVDVSVNAGATYDTLDVYFNELINQTMSQDAEAEITPNVTSVTKTGTIDIPVTKPIVDKTERDVWNGL